MIRHTRFISTVIVFLALLVLVRCGRESPTQPPTSAKITVTPKSPSQSAVGQASTLNAEVPDENGVKIADPIRSSSSDSSAVASVSSGGVVTSRKYRRARIAATSGSASSDVAVSVSAMTSDSDKAALVALYNATNGPNWTNNSNWLSEAPLGQWHGVMTAGSGRVKELRLTQNNLEGPIPAELGSLDELETLSFWSNKLNGAIPSELGKLNNLETLWLAGNDLSGAIPDELGRLVKLWTMSFAGNPGLSGTLPLTFTNLTSLNLLYLSDTAICAPSTPEMKAWLGAIEEHDVTYCTELDIEALTVLYNSTGGSNWTNNKNWLSDADLNDWYSVSTDEIGRVKGLNLQGNNLRGALPPEIADLASLRDLNLSLNDGLIGPLPLELAELGLASLDLNGTHLCAPGDAGFQDWLNSLPNRSVSACAELDTDALVALVGLYASTGGKDWTSNENWLSQAPLAAWHGVTVDANGRVTELDLSDNNLTGSLPSSMSKLADLKKIDLGGNAGLVGPIPESLTGLSIESLDLEGTGLCVPSTSSYQRWLNGIADTSGVDDCAVDVPDWEALVTFYHETNGSGWRENANWLSTEPLDEWFGVSTDADGRVTALALSRNNLLGPLPAALGRLDKLESLDLAGNDLSGPIPPELGGLERLKELYLHTCSISGTIPPELGRLTDLEVLSLWGQGPALTGTLPAELGKLAKLESLDLSLNFLYGPIPEELGRLTVLEFLDLQENGFSGTIPGELGQLTKLAGLHLNGNGLSGGIPRELGRLSELERLDMSRNNLAGPIPQEFGDLKKLEVLDASRNELSGSFPGELGEMTALQTLDLSFNRLSASVPGELGSLTSLKELALAGNTELAGPLPAELAELDLETLMLGDTRLCAPRDAAFQNWLRSVQNSRVTPCAVPMEAAAYLTQASQSLDHPVPLVAGEDALLRVFLKSDDGMEIPMPPVRASFYRGGGIVYIAETSGEASDVPASFEEETLTATANARVPGSAVMPGIEVVIEIDPDRTLDPALGIARRIPETGRIALDVRELPVFDLTLIPFLWVEGPDHSVLSAIDGITPESDLMWATRDLLPVSDLQLSVHAPVWTSVDPVSDNYDLLFLELDAIRAVEGETGYHMGIFRLAGPKSGLAGIAYTPGYLSLSILDPYVIAHELGHNLSLLHSPCGGPLGIDPYYPYEDGSIGVSGYDMMGESLVSSQTSDLMSYCHPQWISDYSFSRALSHRLALGAAPPPPFAAATKGLLIWGGLNEDGELTLEPAFVVDAPLKLPDTDGPYTITGESEGGGNLFSLSFDISEYADVERGGSFAFILPVRETWPGNLRRITLSGPGGFAEIDGDGDRYMALMRDGVTGEVRGIFRDWPDPSDPSTAGRRIPPEPGMEITVSGGIPDQDSW